MTSSTEARARSLTTGLPIVPIAGRVGKTTVARILEALVRDQYPRLLLWTDRGVERNGRREAGELIPWQEGLVELGAGHLDLAVQELDAATVVAVGLPPAAYRVAVITSLCANDETCRIDPMSMMERHAHAVVARGVHPSGALVLNADDQEVATIAPECAGEIIYYGMSRRNPFIKAHLAAGGRAVCLSSRVIVLCEGKRSRPVIPLYDHALSMGGAIVFQVENALAAIAAAWRLGIELKNMERVLREFTSSPTNMPGACNQVEIAGATVLIDRLVDTVTTRQLLRAIRKFPKRGRRLVLLPAQLDLPPAAGTAIGRLIGATCKLVLVHEPANGVASPELRRGIARNRVPPVVLTYALEADALHHLLRILRQGDIALILAQNVPLAIRTVLTFTPPRDTPPAPARLPLPQLR